MLKRLFSSRKFLLGIATAASAVLMDRGFNVNENVILGILGVAAAVILGIAHEDAASKGNPPAAPGDPPPTA